MTGLRIRSAQRGFTLIELVIVMAIVGIITMIAIPSYTQYIAKTRRGTASECLLEYAQFLERNHTLSLSYKTDPSGAAITALPTLQCTTDLSGNFTFDTTTLDDNAFVLAATPSTNQSTADKRCGCTMTLDQVGTKDVTSCSVAADQCW